MSEVNSDCYFCDNPYTRTAWYGFEDGSKPVKMQVCKKCFKDCGYGMTTEKGKKK